MLVFVALAKAFTDADFVVAFAVADFVVVFAALLVLVFLALQWIVPTGQGMSHHQVQAAKYEHVIILSRRAACSRGKWFM